jgi:hypothetical protein
VTDILGGRREGDDVCGGEADMVSKGQEADWGGGGMELAGEESG